MKKDKLEAQLLMYMKEIFHLYSSNGSYNKNIKLR